MTMSDETTSNKKWIDCASAAEAMEADEMTEWTYDAATKTVYIRHDDGVWAGSPSAVDRDWTASVRTEQGVLTQIMVEVRAGEETLRITRTGLDAAQTISAVLTLQAVDKAISPNAVGWTGAYRKEVR
jgi:hypothetical protein